MMKDWRRSIEIENEAEAGFEIERFVVDLETPAIYAAQRVKITADQVGDPRLLVQRDAQSTPAAQHFEILPDSLWFAQQPVRERRNEDGVLVVQTKHSIQVSVAYELPPGVEELIWC
jgi:hypothetical protein